MNDKKIKCPVCKAPFVNEKDKELHYVEVHKGNGKTADNPRVKNRLTT